VRETGRRKKERSKVRERDREGKREKRNNNYDGEKKREMCLWERVLVCAFVRENDKMNKRNL
jgi:hypothetical protein